MDSISYIVKKNTDLSKNIRDLEKNIEQYYKLHDDGKAKF